MRKGEYDNYAFHGFRSAVRNAHLYKNKLKISKFALNRKRLRLQLENRVTGHSIPASGPTRVLALELLLKNNHGEVVYTQTRRFFKHFSMLPIVGGVPFMLIDNTQLQAGEKRTIRFELPERAYQRTTRVIMTLRMYEVADKFEGDLAKAHWVSKPIVRRTIRINSLRKNAG